MINHMVGNITKDLGIKHKILFEKYFLLATNIFKWENLPNNLTSEMIEKVLITNGRGIFFKSDEMGFTFLPSSSLGKVNIYGNDTIVLANGYNFQKKIMVVNNEDKFVKDMNIKNKGVEILNNDIKLPTTEIILYYVRKIYQVENAINMNVRQQKFPTLVVTDTKNEFTLKTLFKKVEEEDNIAIFGSKSLNLENIKIMNTNIPYVVDRLYNYRQQLENELLTELGINNIEEKRERLISEEVNANNDYIFRKIELMYKNRVKACEIINELFNLNIEVKKVDYFHNEIENNMLNLNKEDYNINE